MSSSATIRVGREGMLRAVQRTSVAFVVLACAVAAFGCSKRSSSSSPSSAVPLAAPELETAFHDDFDRAELGADWETDAPAAYTVANGALHVAMAHNQPLWLKRALPHDVRVEVDCTPLTPAIDMKVELFGDGSSHESEADIARDAQYTASGYVLIFGGWQGQLSTIVRRFEHEWQRDPSVPSRRDVHGAPGRKVHWSITRKGSRLTWEVDGQPYLSRDDPHPLEGAGHDRFAFDGWEAAYSCDDLTITPQ